MTVTVEEEAAKTRLDLNSDPTYGADSLLRFATRFAIDRKLRHRALVLGATFADTLDQQSQSEIRNEMLQLVDEVVVDNRSPSEDAVRKKERRKELFDSYRPSEPDRSVVFECSGLGHTFSRGKPDEFHLRGVDLKLRLGQITGVVGENGNGKTTLFRMVVGALKHMEGTLSYPLLSPPTEADIVDWAKIKLHIQPGAHIEADIDWAKVKFQIAYVPQDLPKWYGTLEENLRYAAAIKGITGANNDQEFDYIVERLGLRDYSNHRWSQLSGGFKLRFELARALIWKPKLLVLDEPLANLDYRSQLTVLRDIRDMSRSTLDPMAVLVSSQHLHEVEAIADNILFLTRGRVAYNGPISGIGENRRQNMFEIDCTDDISDLREKLRSPGVERISFNGMSYILTTSRAVGREQVLDMLKDKKIDFTYFRDISRSVKQLFESGDGQT